MWRSLSLPPVEKAVPDEEAPTDVGASRLDRHAGLYGRMVALDQSAEISGGLASVLVDRWHGDLGERPLGFDRFGPHPLDGAVDR
jgi:hypothetical protein